MNKYIITVDKDIKNQRVFNVKTVGKGTWMCCSSFLTGEHSWRYYMYRWRSASKSDRPLMAALIVYILDTCPDLVATFPGGLNE
jgi:hypothetical protein